MHVIMIMKVERVVQVKIVESCGMNVDAWGTGLDKIKFYKVFGMG